MSHARANHVTPDELSARSGFTTEEILQICRSESVPVLHGRIDVSLFALVSKARGLTPGLAAEPMGN